MKYIELTIHTTTEASEIISDIMWQYTDYGVTICDRADIIALQTAKELGSSEVTPEHIILSILKNKKGLSCEKIVPFLNKLFLFNTIEKFYKIITYSCPVLKCSPNHRTSDS